MTILSCPGTLPINASKGWGSIDSLLWFIQQSGSPRDSMKPNSL